MLVCVACSWPRCGSAQLWIDAELVSVGTLDEIEPLAEYTRTRDPHALAALRSARVEYRPGSSTSHTLKVVK